MEDGLYTYDILADKYTPVNDRHTFVVVNGGSKVEMTVYKDDIQVRANNGVIVIVPQSANCIHVSTKPI